MAIVVALYVFVGNSGVVSFGHISFVAVGAWAAGVMTVPVESKPAIMPYLFPFLRDHTVGNIPSLLIAAARRRDLRARSLGLPLMRLSGLAAGIATFGVLEITHNVLRYWTKIGPGSNTFSLGARDDGPAPGGDRRRDRDRRRLRLPASRFGRLLRATREDAAAREAVGVNVHRQRLLAFTLSGALAGFAGGLYVHMLGSITTEQMYLDLTFITLAMLVDRRHDEPLGRRRRRARGERARLVAGRGRERASTSAFTIDLPPGTRLVVLGALMALVLILRPVGHHRRPRVLARPAGAADASATPGRHAS